MFLSQPGILQSLLSILSRVLRKGIYPHDPQVIPAESLAPSLVTDRDRQPEYGEG